jgi:hypothetical protein
MRIAVSDAQKPKGTLDMRIHIPSPDQPETIVTLSEDLNTFNHTAMKGYGNEAHLVTARVPKEQCDFLLIVDVIRPFDGQASLECVFNSDGSCRTFTSLFDRNGKKHADVLMDMASWEGAVRLIISAVKDLVTQTLEAPNQASLITHDIELL